MRIIAFVVILFVVIKPIRAFIIDLSEDKKEQNSIISEEDTSEDDTTEDDALEETIFSSTSEVLHLAKTQVLFKFYLDHSIEYYQCVAYPPPEFI